MCTIPSFFFFFFNDTATTEIYTLSLHDALPIFRRAGLAMRVDAEKKATGLIPNPFRTGSPLSEEEGPELFRGRENAVRDIRSEEHTSELQSQSNLVCRLLLEKKKKTSDIRSNIL